MSLPKTLNRIEEKLDRVLALYTQPALLPENTEEATLDPEAAALALDYDTYNAKEIIDRAPSLTPDQRAALAIYEKAHAGRKTVLEALEAPRADD